MTDVAQRIAELPLEKRKLLELVLRNSSRPKRDDEIVPATRTDFMPLSFAQQRMWFLDQIEGDGALYNIPAAVRLTGVLDVVALETALNEIIRRHESLRTIFPLIEQQPVQGFIQSLILTLSVNDISEFPETARDAELHAAYCKESSYRFDLARGPLVRATLFRLSEHEHILLVVKHHIISDGWSIHIFMRELGILYEAYTRGERSPLAELPIQYADYAIWQRQWLCGQLLDRQLCYWKQQLAGPLPLLQLPADRPRPPSQSFKGSSVALRLKPELTHQLKAMARREGVTLYMLLLAAFYSLLFRYTSEPDIIIGTDVAGRSRREVEGLIGFFVNQLVLRVKLSADLSFREVLKRVKEVCLAAYANQDVPFEKLVEELQPRRQAGVHPLFQVKFVFWQSPTLALKSSELMLSAVNFDSHLAKLLLTLFVVDTENELALTLEYRSDLFEPATALKMARQLESILIEAASNLNTRLLLLGRVMKAEGVKPMEQKELQEASRARFKKLRPKLVSLPQGEVVRFNHSFSSTLPLVVEPNVDNVEVVDWARANLPLIEAKLLEAGCLLFRGFKIESLSLFERLASTLCKDLFNENGEHPRESISGNVYTPVSYPAQERLLWHNENSFNMRFPMKILFCCLKPADQGGETPVADSRQVYQLIDPEIREAFSRKKIMYVRNYGGRLGLDWQTVFNTTSREEVEAHCRNASMEWQWKGDGQLKTRSVRPAVIRHPKSGAMSWFNQAQHWHISCLDPETRKSIMSMFGEQDAPRNCYYGDGSRIEDDVMQEILNAYRRLEVTFQPMKGDVLLLDNVSCAHGRNPFKGERKVLVAMGEMHTSSLDD